MNTQLNNLLKAISNSETKELTTIVTETLAVEINRERAFTAADLWNIQRHKKTHVRRGYFA